MFSSQNNNSNAISATVFVQETWDTINGETVCTNSRLLSKNEVETIGMENFASANTMTRSDYYPEDGVSTRYKLTLTLMCTPSVNNLSSKCTVVGSAVWSGYDTINGIDSPAKGNDFIGVTWGGGFTSKNINISGTTMQGKDMEIYPSDSVATAGAVWDFQEYWPSNAAQPRADYAKELNLNMTLSKNTMTGNGNETEVILKYVHTYESPVGSASISVGSGGSVGASYSVSNTEKQWNLVVKYSGLLY